MSLHHALTRYWLLGHQQGSATQYARDDATAGNCSELLACECCPTCLPKVFGQRYELERLAAASGVVTAICWSG